MILCNSTMVCLGVLVQTVHLFYWLISVTKKIIAIILLLIFSNHFDFKLYGMTFG